MTVVKRRRLRVRAPCRNLHLRPLALHGRSLTMIDRHYGHLARDGREHAIRLLDELSTGQRPRWTLVDAAWTPEPAAAASLTTEVAAKQEKTRSPLTDSNRRPCPYHRATRREGRARPGSRGHESRARRRNRPKGSNPRGRACPRWCSLSVPSTKYA